MILIVGATGNLGGEITRQLAESGRPIRAMVRATSDPAKVDMLKGLGAEIVQGEMQDPTSLDMACQGVSAVISTVSAMPSSYQPEENNIQDVDIQGLSNLIEAAKNSGVDHFIYTSFSGGIDLDFPLRNAKRTVEEQLKASGLTYTILRPSYFMEAWLSPAIGFDYVNGTAQICGTGAGPISWISVPDVAAFAVASLDNPAARNAVIELGGPEALSPLEVVKIFEEVGGKQFELSFVPEEALAEQQASSDDPMQQSFAGLMLCNAKGDPIDMQATLAAFPIQVTSVRDYAKSVLVPVS